VPSAEGADNNKDTGRLSRRAKAVERLRVFKVAFYRCCLGAVHTAMDGGIV
jgi:hypothetical protein